MLKSSIVYPNDDQYGQRKRWIEKMLQYNLEHISRLGFPIVLKQGEATLDDICIHAILRQRLHKNTVMKRRSRLIYMTEHEVPVNIQRPKFENWINHIDFREQVEQAGAFAIANEWDSMRMVLRAYGLPIWSYKPPSRHTKKAHHLPLPKDVRKLIHYKYTGRLDKDRHIQYVLCHTFMLGLRNPSETCKLTVNDIDLDNGLILVTEPKKHENTRLIAPNKHFMFGKNCKSMKNWVDHIRPKYETKHSKNALYITLNEGKPFTRSYLSRYLNKRVKPVYPEYHPYISRHWAATAMLIKEYIETKHWNRNRVQNWLGHDKETTTNTYISQAETYYRLAPYDWFERVLRKSSKQSDRFEENTSKINRRQKTALLNRIPPVEGNGRGGVLTHLLLLIKLIERQIRIYQFQQITKYGNSNPSFFFFFCSNTEGTIIITLSIRWCSLPVQLIRLKKI